MQVAANDMMVRVRLATTANNIALFDWSPKLLTKQSHLIPQWTPQQWTSRVVKLTPAFRDRTPMRSFF